MLEISDLSVSYRSDGGVQQAVKNVSFDVRKGEFFTLLGPSGCGKTTTLRSVAGFEIPHQGRIEIGGDPVYCAADGTFRPVNRRDIAMVFQSYAIWPHMTVYENVAFPLNVAGLATRAARSRVVEALELVGLADYIDRSASQLSGGQQQRVALARAIIKNAKLLLLDEPLSNLDAKLRDQMRAELRLLQERLGTTTIYVTHDQEEALSLSDRIALMRDGEIVEIGTPRDLYLRPERLFTAEFLGQTEILDCTFVAVDGEGSIVRTGLGDVAVGGPRRPKSTCRLMIRPEHIAILDQPVSGERANVFDGVIASATFSGRIVEYAVRLGAASLRAHTLSTRLRQAGDTVSLYLPPERCVLIEDDQSQRAWGEGEQLSEG